MYDYVVCQMLDVGCDDMFVGLQFVGDQDVVGDWVIDGDVVMFYCCSVVVFFDGKDILIVVVFVDCDFGYEYFVFLVGDLYKNFGGYVGVYCGWDFFEVDDGWEGC